MIISKDSNNNWTPVATGNGTFVGTLVAFNAVKDTLPNNTVAYITDDGAGIADVVADGNMNPVTSNAVYDALNTVETGTNGLLTWAKTGHLLKFILSGQLNDGDTFTLPYTAVINDAFQIFWGPSILGYVDLRGASMTVYTSSSIQNGFVSGSVIVQ